MPHRVVRIKGGRGDKAPGAQAVMTSQSVNGGLEARTCARRGAHCRGCCKECEWTLSSVGTGRTVGQCVLINRRSVEKGLEKRSLAEA